MVSRSIWHLMVLVVLVLVVWAFIAVFGRILNRAGYSRWWLLTVVVPLLNLIMLWVFAFASWPVTRASWANLNLRRVRRGLPGIGMGQTPCTR